MKYVPTTDDEFGTDPTTVILPQGIDPRTGQPFIPGKLYWEPGLHGDILAGFNPFDHKTTITRGPKLDLSIGAGVVGATATGLLTKSIGYALLGGVGGFFLVAIGLGLSATTCVNCK